MATITSTINALRKYSGPKSGVEFNRLILAANKTKAMQKDIADAVGCSKSSVGNYVRRAIDDQAANPDSYKVTPNLTVQMPAAVPAAPTTPANQGITLKDLLASGLITQKEIDDAASWKSHLLPQPTVPATPVIKAPTVQISKREKSKVLAPIVLEIYALIINNGGSIKQGDLGKIFGCSDSWACKILVDAGIRQK